MTTPDTIKEEFEKIGMVRVLKEAQGFNKAQYLLMIKLFGDFILSKALDEQKREQKNKIVKLKQELANKPVNERGSRGYWLNRVEEEL